MATTEKYDRQLRLWGSHGQRALMGANVVLLGADAVGTETLKNLVLPGIGKFIVVDGKVVSEQDLGTNFFVTKGDLGKPRASAVCMNLREMNDDGEGAAIDTNPEDMKAESFLELKPTLIIASNQAHQFVLKIADICAMNSISLIVVRSYGFIGYLRLQVQKHDIIEGKPDPSNGIIHDTRVGNPFPALEAFANSISLDKLSPYDHKHVPYIVILLQVLQAWLSQQGRPPTRRDKDQLVAMVKALSDDYAPPTPFSNEASEAEWRQFRGWNYEENFKEAVKNVSKLWAPKGLRSELQEMIQECAIVTDRCRKGSQAHSHFSILLHALSVFMASNANQVPHSGEIPDMVSSTSVFVGLQKVYEAKAVADKNQLRSIANAKCVEIGLPPVEEEMLDLFCKNIFDITQCNHRSIREEVVECNVDEIQASLFEPAELKEQTPIVWYFVLHAVDTFYNQNGRYPGQLDNAGPEALQSDSSKVWLLIQARVAQLGLTAELIDAGFLTAGHAKEIVRYGGCEMHNISAIIGGVASQEAVKIITHQYTPLDNTYIFNGVACIGGKYTL